LCGGRTGNGISEVGCPQGIFVEDVKKRTTILNSLPFNAANKFSASLIHDGEKHLLLFFGAPDIFIGHSTLSSMERDAALKEISFLAESGELIVGVATKEVEKKALVSGLLVQLNDLKANFTMLEKELETKKDENYDVSSVNLDDLKKLVRDAEAALIKGDSEQGEVSFTLALDEYKNQKIKIEEAKKIKKSFTQILRENALLISTFAGSLIALFTLIEILKKKKESLYQKIKEVRVDKNTRIVVEKKQNDKQSKKEEDNDPPNFDLPGNDNN